MEDAKARPVSYGFAGTREQALVAIYKLGAKHCLYSAGDKWADFCDCKFGGGHIHSGMGEQVGCPELRTLHMIVNFMTDDEWEGFIERWVRASSRPSRPEPCEARVNSRAEVVVEGTGWPEPRQPGPYAVMLNEPPERTEPELAVADDAAIVQAVRERGLAAVRALIREGAKRQGQGLRTAEGTTVEEFWRREDAKRPEDRHQGLSDPMG